MISWLIWINNATVIYIRASITEFILKGSIALRVLWYLRKQQILKLAVCEAEIEIVDNNYLSSSHYSEVEFKSLNPYESLMLL